MFQIKPTFFQAKAKFFGQRPAVKNEKQTLFLYLLNEKMELIRRAR